jgi:2-C-methyl-D-erythritol 4-phosphate cytidylyltransferase
MHQTSVLIIESGMGSGNQLLKKCHALLPTAGTGSRLGGDLPKQFQELAGRPMLSFAIEAFMKSPLIDPLKIIQLIQSSKHIQLNGQDKLKVLPQKDREFEKLEQRLDAIRQVLRRLNESAVLSTAKAN